MLEGCLTLELALRSYCRALAAGGETVWPPLGCAGVRSLARPLAATLCSRCTGRAILRTALAPPVTSVDPAAAIFVDVPGQDHLLPLEHSGRSA